MDCAGPMGLVLIVCCVWRVSLHCSGYATACVIATITNDRTCTTLLDPTNFLELYSVYRRTHTASAPRFVFQCRMFYLLEHEHPKVIGKLLSKDVAAPRACNR